MFRKYSAAESVSSHSRGGGFGRTRSDGRGCCCSCRRMWIGVRGRVRAGIARRDKRREETAAAAAALYEIVFLAPCRRRTPPYPSLPPTFPVVHPHPSLVAYCLVGLTKAPPPANPFNFFTTCDRQPASIIPSQMRYRPQFRCRCRRCRRRRRRFRRQNTYSTTVFPAPFTVGHRPMSKKY